jgi:hypothetical protein
MPDPIEQLTRLRSAETDLPAALAPAEVRRRGDRRRRRNRALAAVGAVAAAAVIVTPLAVRASDAGSHKSQEPQVAVPSVDRNADGWATSIPKRFPIATDLKAQKIEDPYIDDPVELSARLEARPDAPWIMLPCRQSHVPADRVRSDYAAALDTNSGYNKSSELALYPDAATAERAAEQLVAHIPDCSRTLGKSPQWAPVTADFGGDQDYALIGESSSHQRALAVVRVGNAVLVTEEETPEVTSTLSDALTTRTRSLVDSMCLFAEHPCATWPAG